MADPTDRDDALPPVEDDYLWDRGGAPDPEVARLESLLAPLAHADRPLELPAAVVPIGRARRRRWPIVGAAAIAAAAAVILVVVIRRRGAGPADGCDGGAGFVFSADAAVRCDRGTGARGTLAVGGWIETAAGTARIEIADIGAVELAPRSRLALRGTSAAEHRLALERGALHARVAAPPRLFVIETPSATAVDLGCEYDLSVGPDGIGTLTVITGQVELAAPGGAIVLVPAATTARFTPRGVGLPVRVEASPALRDAVASFDPASPESVQAILSAAADGDQITLVNLLVVAAPYQREAVYDALFAVVPAPEDVLRDAIIAGDDESIARWRSAVVDGWMVSEWCTGQPGKVDPHSPSLPPLDPPPAPDAAPHPRSHPAPDAAPDAAPPATSHPAPDAAPHTSSQSDAPPLPPMPTKRATDPTGWGPQ